MRSVLRVEAAYGCIPIKHTDVLTTAFTLTHKATKWDNQVMSLLLNILNNNHYTLGHLFEALRFRLELLKVQVNVMSMEDGSRNNMCVTERGCVCV